MATMATSERIEQLMRESGEAGDLKQAALCAIALGEELPGDGGQEQAALVAGGMTRGQARTACVVTLEHAADRA